MNILDLFQGIGTMAVQSPQIVAARVVLILLGFLLVYLGTKGTLEPLIMVPMGLEPGLRQQFPLSAERMVRWFYLLP